ncbi:Chromosome complete related, putative [Babesia ovata]|uniref:Chromosome complete related, putative n=1 Tax=Babesia ovata TaxID=189622 RepID=A0A2H6K9H6_9APIC|nr:Chromosome complete related, putative [Babesia ovata]GBE59609.1 Chromosome complete related, putative [Babesia ovata]
METYSGHLAAELLDVTGRYLHACNLKSFVLPLPFCDETILDRSSLMVKVLGNASCLSKEQLFDVVHALAGDERKPRSKFDEFSRAYDTVGARHLPTRSVRKVQPPQSGIRSTLRPSTTAMSEKLMVELSSMHEPAKIAQKIDEALCQISQSDTVGFVLIIAAERNTDNAASEDNGQLLPLAGALVEILDAEEHCIRCLWCDPKLIKKDDPEFEKILAIRVLGHLFDYGFPGAPLNNKLKHASVLNVHGILFPNAAYTFLINGLKFGKHFETQQNGGSHEDSSSNFCRCHRLAESPDAELFWGISESRLRTTFYNIKGNIPVKPSEHTLSRLQKILKRSK